MGKSIRGCVVGIADTADFRERKSLSAMQKVLTDCRSSQISGNYMELLKLLFEVRFRRDYGMDFSAAFAAAVFFKSLSRLKFN